jgi:Hermansky-Pudlak syndrome 1 protein
MLDVWIQLRDSEQAFLVEAVEQLSVNPDIATATMKALQDATERLKAATDFNRIHALIFVENKFLSLYSRFVSNLHKTDPNFDNFCHSRGAQDLTPADILFLTVLTEVYQPVLNSSKVGQHEKSVADDFEHLSLSDESTHNPAKPLLSTTESKSVQGVPLSGSNLVMLVGSPSGFNPHVVHVAPVSEKVALVLVLEVRFRFFF